jgi:hypothetical protein
MVGVPPVVPPTGVEPAHMASEANALSAELRGPAGLWPTNGEFTSHHESPKNRDTR